MPAKKRRRTADYINVRLSPTFDEDLIEWWGLQPDGIGAAVVKKAIRQYIESASGNDMASQFKEQRRLIEQLIFVVASLKKQIEVGGIVLPDLPETESDEERRLSESERAERLDKIRGRKW